MKKLLAFLIFTTLAFVACETCTECTYTYTNANGESRTENADFCSEDSDEVNAFENGIELDANNLGTMATCTRQ